MFRGSEYRLAVIGGFAASSIVGEERARDASAKQCLLEVADWSGTPGVTSTFGASLPVQSCRACLRCVAQFLRLSSADANPDVKAGP
jgi:hypothetical protein